MATPAPSQSSDVPVEDSIHWIESEKEYAIGLHEGKLVSRNPKGKKLASVPKWLKENDQSQQLLH